MLPSNTYDEAATVLLLSMRVPTLILLVLLLAQKLMLLQPSNCATDHQTPHFRAYLPAPVQWLPLLKCHRLHRDSPLAPLFLFRNQRW